MKVKVMRAAVFTKFTQPEEPLALLLSTGDAKIIAAEDDDNGSAGRDGKNMLGHILLSNQ